MNKNVAIVMVILVVLVLAGYLVWIRSTFFTANDGANKIAASIAPIATSIPTPSAMFSPSPEASKSASPSAKIASRSAKLK